MRAAWPDARLDWLVDGRYRALLDFVPILDHVIVTGRGQEPALGVARALRRQRYDLAVDFQGLIKSAVWARASGARQVVGFGAAGLRERAAGLFYTARAEADDSGHVIAKNLSMLRHVGIEPGPWVFPLVPPMTPIVAEVRARLGIGGSDRFAVINPGAGWPNKRWPPERFGQVAAGLAERHGLKSVILWGPGEQPLATTVAAASGGTAISAPPTGLGDVLALCRAASLFVAGDTGPLQIAAAMGTPIVAVFGPTNPARNGPWSPSDVSLSRFDRCECHHKRQCRREIPCLLDIGVKDVNESIDHRLTPETAS